MGRSDQVDVTARRVRTAIACGSRPALIPEQRPGESAEAWMVRVAQARSDIGRATMSPELRRCVDDTERAIVERADPR